MENDYSLLSILKMLAKWKKHIMIATVGTFLLACVITLMMPNYYKSKSVFYAANPLLANPAPIGPNEEPISLYGTDEDLDRIFTLARSKEVFDHLIDSFDLAAHYDIDSSTPKGQEKIYKKLNKLYETIKTKYGALALSIEDVDPKMAMAMAGAAREKIVSLSQHVVKESQSQSIIGKDKVIQSQQEYMDGLSDQIKGIKEKYEIYDSDTQGELYAEQLTKTYAQLEAIKAQLHAAQKSGMPRDSIMKFTSKKAGLESKKKYLDGKIKLYNQGLLKLKELERQHTQMSYALSLDKERNKKLVSSFESPYTVIHVVEKESMPIDKSRPRRSILVLAFTFLAFLLSCLAAIFYESTRSINWKEIYAG